MRITLKYCMAFDILFGPILRVNVGSRIIVSQQSPITMRLLWLRAMTLTLIPLVRPWDVPLHLKNNWWWERHIQVFMVFDIMFCRLVFRVVVENQIVVSTVVIMALSLCHIFHGVPKLTVQDAYYSSNECQT